MQLTYMIDMQLLPIDWYAAVCMNEVQLPHMIAVAAAMH